MAAGKHGYDEQLANAYRSVFASENGLIVFCDLFKEYIDTIRTPDELFNARVEGRRELVHSTIRLLLDIDEPLLARKLVAALLGDNEWQKTKRSATART